MKFKLNFSKKNLKRECSEIIITLISYYKMSKMKDF